jgi:hypothetical protein
VLDRSGQGDQGLQLVNQVVHCELYTGSEESRWHGINRAGELWHIRDKTQKLPNHRCKGVLDSELAAILNESGALLGRETVDPGKQVFEEYCLQSRDHRIVELCRLPFGGADENGVESEANFVHGFSHHLELPR